MSVRYPKRKTKHTPANNTGICQFVFPAIYLAAELKKIGYGRYMDAIKNEAIPRPLKSYVDIFDSAAERIRQYYVIGNDGRHFHPVGLGN